MVSRSPRNISGAVLGLVARRGDTLAAFAARFPSHSISIYPADVRDAAAQFCAQHGGADVVIANAGVSCGALTGYGDLHAFRDVMDINYFGMIATFEPFVASMVEERRGTLVGIASVVGIRGLPGSGAYSASKSAALKYLESLRVDMRRKEVSVVTIAPGYIRTAMTEHNPYPMPFLMDADIRRQNRRCDREESPVCDFSLADADGLGVRRLKSSRYL